jgi:hypothetical protein
LSSSQQHLTCTDEPAVVAVHAAARGRGELRKGRDCYLPAGKETLSIGAVAQGFGDGQEFSGMLAREEAEDWGIIGNS